ncbi:hypothetical protein FUAX_02570 [Fulvitalea axinellae]|uniref:Uncharacterized protein n=1 Tax=Fulvitalea axinellae TaxID=1182444 RepID=A0AAU9DAD2_9BACT|nr:hypothetical protein FUAX_02570 [Fulvitalea axinellae]
MRYSIMGIPFLLPNQAFWKRRIHNKSKNGVSGLINL